MVDDDKLCEICQQKMTYESQWTTDASGRERLSHKWRCTNTECTVNSGQTTTNNSDADEI